EVAVNYSVRVREGDGGDNLPRQRFEVFDADSFVFYNFVERSAFEILHHDKVTLVVGFVLGLPDAVNGADVRVFERGGGLRFLDGTAVGGVVVFRRLGARFPRDRT